MGWLIWDTCNDTRKVHLKILIKNRLKFLHWMYVYLSIITPTFPKWFEMVHIYVLNSQIYTHTNANLRPWKKDMNKTTEAKKRSYRGRNLGWTIYWG